MDDTFQEHLLNLHKKLNFLEKNEAAQNSAAYKDVAPELEKLRVKAISKSRDYLMQRIYALRKPKTNIQILQQNVLLKYKYLVTFLRLHGGEVFNEVRAAYIDTLSRVLSSHFRAYLAAIERLKVSASFLLPFHPIIFLLFYHDVTIILSLYHDASRIELHTCMQYLMSRTQGFTST